MSEGRPNIKESHKYLNFLLTKMYSPILKEEKHLLLTIIRDMIRVQLEIVGREKNKVEES